MAKPELVEQLADLRDDVEGGRYVTMPDGQTYCEGEGLIAQHYPAIVFLDYRAEVLGLIDQMLELACDHALYKARDRVSRAQNVTAVYYALYNVASLRRAGP